MRRSRWKQFHLVALLALTLDVMLPGSALAGAGELDQSFGRGGKITTACPGRASAQANAVAIQSDGRIVAVGSGFGKRGAFAVARYRKQGALDPTFGGDGRVVTPFDSGEGFGVAIQDDGRIVVAGRMADARGKSRFALARYRRDGTLDPTFGGDGRVTTHFPGGEAWASSVAIQANGMIVAAGRYIPSNLVDSQSFAIARYRPDGTLDHLFDGDGMRTLDFPAWSQSVASAVAIQGDDKIVVAGWTGSGGDFDGRFALARLIPRGVLDRSFGHDGRVTTDVRRHVTDMARALAILPNGRILLAGFSGVTSSVFALARYRPDGTLDPAWGGDGTVTTRIRSNVPAGIIGVAMQTDGGVVAVGDLNDEEFVLARYRPSGSLDDTFGRNGTVITNFGEGVEYGTGVAIQPNGRIVAVGTSHYRFALARYLAQ